MVRGSEVVCHRVLILNLVTFFVRDLSLGRFTQLSSYSADRERKTYRNWGPWRLLRNPGECDGTGNVLYKCEQLYPRLIPGAAF